MIKAGAKTKPAPEAEKPDAAIIRKLGIPAIVALGFTEASVIQWRTRGVIPWKARAKIKALAAKQRERLPAGFADNRPAYPQRAA